jgi:hypothetical protein
MAPTIEDIPTDDDRFALPLAIEAYSLAINHMENDTKIGEIYINDGNWGCGAFGHNMNAIYVLTTSRDFDCN